MDPFTALGVAASAVQFFEFTRGLKEMSARRASVAPLTTETFETTTRDLLTYMNKALQLPAADGTRIADRLVEITKKLTPRAKQEKWTSFLQALKSVLKADELESLSNQLELYQNEIVVRSLAFLNEKANVLLNKSTDQADMVLHSNREIIESLQSVLSLQAADEHRESQAGISDFGRIQNAILDCLHFRQIVDRYGGLIFSDPEKHGKVWSNFVDWLESNTGCYWIQGKPCSGKSTLMKTIMRDTRTISHLEKWAGSRPLLTSSFFFWYLGTPLQKSQEGLLRALLHSVLRQVPRLIGEVMPDLCLEATKFDPTSQLTLEPPNLSKLTRWFTNLVNALKNDGSQRVCIFVDGLDDLCGRVFIIFSKDQIHDKYRFLNFIETRRFIEKVVNRSDGVFLWVSLVIKSLLEARLIEMPSGVSELYRHMLDRIPLKYKKQAAEMLQLATLNFGGRLSIRGSGFFYPFTALQLSYAFQKPEDILTNPHEKLSDSEAVRRIEHVEIRIRSRCLGFLELRGPPPSESIDPFRQPTVELIHRTAMEFFGSGEILRILRGLSLGQEFDLFLVLFASSIWMIRACSSIDLTNEYLEPVLLLANSAELVDSPFRKEYLDSLNESLQSHFIVAVYQDRVAGYQNRMKITQNLEGHWFECMLRVWHAESIPECLRSPSIDVVTMARIRPYNLLLRTTDLTSTYVGKDLRKKILSYNKKLGFPMWQRFSHCCQLRLPDISHKPDIWTSIFNQLLESGADPNHQSYDNYTIWELFLWRNIRTSISELCRLPFMQRPALQPSHSRCSCGGVFFLS
ncbi:hypothetical protein F5Y19DRAFT_465067 [Xylariaceae sp. FL1651]|nr:hypothetical protein F5Y19DRAFT_465067 [Xylariaceae sp. FL1651]